MYSEMPPDLVYTPSTWRQIWFAISYLAWPTVLVALVSLVAWPSWLKLLASALLILGGVLGFPRNSFGCTLVAGHEVLTQRTRKGQVRTIPWRDVTAYRLSGRWLHLLKDEGQVTFLFSRPLLVRSAGEFRDFAVSHLSSARKLSFFGYVKLLFQSARDGRSSAHDAEPRE